MQYIKKILPLVAVKFNKFKFRRATVSERNSAKPLQKKLCSVSFVKSKIFYVKFRLALNFSKVRPTNVARFGQVYTADLQRYK